MRIATLAGRFLFLRHVCNSDRRAVVKEKRTGNVIII